MKSSYLLQARWITLLIFPIGYLLTEEAFTYEWGFYAALNLLSFLSGSIILWRLRRISLESIVVWFVWFVLLIGYYYKFYFLVYGISQGQGKQELSVMSGSIAPLFASTSVLLECYVTITVSFFATAIATLFLLRKRKNLIQPFKHAKHININKSLITHRLLVLSSLLWVGSGFFRKYYNLGVPYQAVYLPYKLAGIITVINGMIVPMLITLALLSALRCGKIQHIRLTVGLFIVWGLLEFILFTSKTYLVLPLVVIFASGVLYGRPILRMKYLAWYGGIFLLFYPFFNIFRSIQNLVHGRDTLFNIPAMLRILSDTIGDVGIVGFFFYSLGSLAGRITGLDSLLLLTATRPDYSAANIMDLLLGKIDSPEQIISGMHNIPFTGVAASLLGQAYFATGSYLITAAWTASWLVFAYWLTTILMKRNTLISHTALLFWLVMVVQWSADGITYFKIELFVVAILVSSIIAYLVGIGRYHNTAVKFVRS